MTLTGGGCTPIGLEDDVKLRLLSRRVAINKDNSDIFIEDAIFDEEILIAEIGGLLSITKPNQKLGSTLLLKGIKPHQGSSLCRLPVEKESYLR